MKKIHFSICILILVFSASLGCDSETLLEFEKPSVHTGKMNTLSPEVLIARGGKKKMKLSKKIQSPDKKTTVIFSKPMEDPGSGILWKQAEIIYNDGKVAQKHIIRISQISDLPERSGFDTYSDAGDIQYLWSPDSQYLVLLKTIIINPSHADQGLIFIHVPSGKLVDFISKNTDEVCSFKFGFDGWEKGEPHTVEGCYPSYP
ncbi:hypothetical protein [Anthocerotibacter panamensis]|uniref:hypothetical protein n=1 Tax=Anthocerotibacter panamensis TaxID=2857077 RepID=UPI001C407626|nr:hypothetical protein [Anthocerotibacter panamensis]